MSIRSFSCCAPPHHISVGFGKQAFGLAIPSGRLPRRTGTCIFLCGSRETPAHPPYGSSVREPGRSRSYQSSDHEFLVSRFSERCKSAKRPTETHPFVAILPMDRFPSDLYSDARWQLESFANWFERMQLAEWNNQLPELKMPTAEPLPW